MKSSLLQITKWCSIAIHRCEGVYIKKENMLDYLTSKVFTLDFQLHELLQKSELCLSKVFMVGYGWSDSPHPKNGQQNVMM